MKKRNSRYLLTGGSFSAIARLPSGSLVMLPLNLSEEDALREVSKSLKAAFSRVKKRCSLKAGDALAAFTSRKSGAATHLYVTVL